MHPYTAYVTPRDGIPRRLSLTAADLDDARQRALALAAAQLPGQRFSFTVWSA